MIYVDIDGVVADFYNKVLEVTGKPYDPGLSWSEIESIDNFYSKLKVIDDPTDGIFWLEKNEDFQFLGSLPKPTGKLITAQRDKVDWIKNTVSSSAQVNLVRHWSEKATLFCREGDILIDDSARNCKHWEDHGGIAILHKNWYDTIVKLKEILND